MPKGVISSFICIYLLQILTQANNNYNMTSYKQYDKASTLNIIFPKYYVQFMLNKHFICANYISCCKILIILRRKVIADIFMYYKSFDKHEGGSGNQNKATVQNYPILSGFLKIVHTHAHTHYKWLYFLSKTTSSF